MKRFIFALILLAPGALFAQEASAFQLGADSLQLRAGGSADLKLDVRLPQDNHIYVKHAGPSLNIVTEFSTDSPGWIVAVEKAPRGLRHENDMILKGRGESKSAGSYTLGIYETKGREPSSKKHSVNIKISTQMCDSKTNRCFRPKTIEKTVSVLVNAQKAESAAAPVKTRGGIQWVTKYDDALSRAKQNGRNIFVVITAPSWCGYCKVLERNVFSKASVARTLNSKFVPLRILDSNPDRSRFDFSGYPTMFVAASGGKILSEIYGRNESAFLNSVKKFENDGDEDSGAAESFAYTVRLSGKFEREGDEWIRREGDTVRRYTETRRDANFIVLKDKESGEFIALPLKKGKGFVYRDGQWIEAFTVD